VALSDFAPVEEQLRVIRRGTAEIFPEEELIEKLKKSREENRPLRVKYGIDPTAPDVHLGHTVPIRKLRHFQDLGHKAVVIIGDYTAMVGDPSGRDETRGTRPTHEAVLKTAATYIEQLGKILDLDQIEIRHNGDWFREMTFGDVITLTSKITLARIIERDDFQKRLQAGTPISLHECLYSLMQGHDSVMIEADVELGGTEQKYALLVGRDLQKDAGQEPQACITFPILVGTDGVRRMGKSLGNYVGIDEPPEEMFGKLMSVPDNVMRDYLELITDVPEERIDELLSDGTHPRDAKVTLAKTVVGRYHGDEAADSAEAAFDKVFRKHEAPDDMPTVSLGSSDLDDGKIWIAKLIVACGFAKGNGEARRLVIQGGVSLDGEKVTDAGLDWVPQSGTVLKVGKRRFARIEVQA